MDICDIKSKRIISLNQMHSIICNINNEDMYGDWMLLVRSSANFDIIAASDDYYDECNSFFADLVTDVSYWN